LSSPKQQKREKESKHELEEIKKDNIEAEKRTEVEIDSKENSDEGIAVSHTQCQPIYFEDISTII
jgi:hypothetical protein